MRPSIFSNCEEDADTHLLNNDNLDEATKHNIEDFNESLDSSSSSVSSVSLSSMSFPEESVDDYTPSVTLEQCSNTYFSGYLGKKCVEKFKCRLCENFMLKETNDEQFNEKEFLIFCKNYDLQSSNLFLRRPTDLFEKFIFHAQIIIKKMVEKMPHKKSISKCIQQKIKNELIETITFHTNCQPHIDFIIQHLIMCRLLRDFNWKSRNIKKIRTEKSKQKLKILRNV